MPTATNRNPVAVFYPLTEQYVIVKRGDEFDANHPFAKDKANAYLFEEDRGEGSRLYPVDGESVEQATQGPGEKRRVGRPRKDEGEPVKDEGSGNGPLRSGDRPTR